MVFKSSFEDFLYVLIGLVWVAFSIYKGRQKKKNAQKPEGEKNTSKSAIEEIIGEFLGVKDENVVYRETDTAVQPENSMFEEVENTNTETETTSSEVFSFDKAVEEGNLFKEKRVYTTELSELRKSKFKKDIKQKVKRKKPRINIRKAVIYSEILKRPTY